MMVMVRSRSGWNVAMLYGAGHGGIESILVGLGAAWALVSMALLPSLGNLTNDQRPVRRLLLRHPHFQSG